MGQIDWGQMLGQGLDILGSLRSRRGGGGMAAAPSMGFMGVPQPGGGGARAVRVDEFGNPIRRRRRRGITAGDLRSFRRVANLIRAYAAPVRHFRTRPKRRFGR